MSNEQAEIGLKLLANLDKDLIVTDVTTGKKLTPELLYNEYFKDLTSKHIFDFYLDKIKDKHEIMNKVDEEKQQIKKLIVEQPTHDNIGNPVVYLTLAEAREHLSDFLNETKEEDDEIYVNEITDEGLIYVKDNIKHIAVREIFDKNTTMADWTGEKCNV